MELSFQFNVGLVRDAPKSMFNNVLASTLNQKAAYCTRGRAVGGRARGRPVTFYRNDLLADPELEPHARGAGGSMSARRAKGTVKRNVIRSLTVESYARQSGDLL